MTSRLLALVSVAFTHFVCHVQRTALSLDCKLIIMIIYPKFEVVAPFLNSTHALLVYVVFSINVFECYATCISSVVFYLYLRDSFYHNVSKYIQVL